MLDGEAVILGVDGIADFNALHSRQHDEDVQFCAFDTLVEGWAGLQKLPLHLRKVALSADRWPDDARLSDIELPFVCAACGERGADVRPA